MNPNWRGLVRVVVSPGIGPTPGYTPRLPRSSVTPSCFSGCDPKAVTEKMGRRWVDVTFTSASALSRSSAALRIARLLASAACTASVSVVTWAQSVTGTEMHATAKSQSLSRTRLRFLQIAYGQVDENPSRIRFRHDSSTPNGLLILRRQEALPAVPSGLDAACS